MFSQNPKKSAKISELRGTEAFRSLKECSVNNKCGKKKKRKDTGNFDAPNLVSLNSNHVNGFRSPSSK